MRVCVDDVVEGRPKGTKLSVAHSTLPGVFTVSSNLLGHTEMEVTLGGNCE